MSRYTTVLLLKPSLVSHWSYRYSARLLSPIWMRSKACKSHLIACVFSFEVVGLRLQQTAPTSFLLWLAPSWWHQQPRKYLDVVCPRFAIISATWTKLGGGGQSRCASAQSFWGFHPQICTTLAAPNPGPFAKLLGSSGSSSPCVQQSESSIGEHWWGPAQNWRELRRELRSRPT